MKNVLIFLFLSILPLSAQFRLDVTGKKVLADFEPDAGAIVEEIIGGLNLIGSSKVYTLDTVVYDEIIDINLTGLKFIGTFQTLNIRNVFFQSGTIAHDVCLILNESFRSSSAVFSWPDGGPGITPIFFGNQFDDWEMQIRNNCNFEIGFSFLSDINSVTAILAPGEISDLSPLFLDGQDSPMAYLVTANSRDENGDLITMTGTGTGREVYERFLNPLYCREFLGFSPLTGGTNPPPPSPISPPDPADVPPLPIDGGAGPDPSGEVVAELQAIRSILTQHAVDSAQDRAIADQNSAIRSTARDTLLQGIIDSVEGIPSTGGGGGGGSDPTTGDAPDGSGAGSTFEGFDSSSIVPTLDTFETKTPKISIDMSWVPYAELGSYDFDMSDPHLAPLVAETRVILTFIVTLLFAILFFFSAKKLYS